MSAPIYEILQRPSTHVLEAVTHFDRNASFIEVKDWIRDNATRLSVVTLKERDEIRLRQMQGAAQVLVELIDTLDSARDIVNKVK